MIRVNYSIDKDQSVEDFVETSLRSKEDAIYPPIDNTYWDKDINTLQRFPKNYSFPKTHMVSAWLKKPLSGECEWQYGNFKKQQPCKQRIKFIAQTQFGNDETILTVSRLDSSIKLKENILIKDRLILGLGDSFGSGESNPDIPSVVDREALDALAKRSIKDDYLNMKNSTRWLTDSKFSWNKQDAQWLDAQCHRSFLSQHILTAMKIAAENPKNTITLIPLACSGAQVNQGILSPQKEPPNGKPLKESQLNAAIRYLCSGSLEKKDNTIGCRGEIRQPDAILLSIGGNDVGFIRTITTTSIPMGYRNLGGRVITKFLHHYFEAFCLSPDLASEIAISDEDIKRRLNKICNNQKGTTAIELIEGSTKDSQLYELSLPYIYKKLHNELNRNGLIKDGKNIYLTAYPNILSHKNFKNEEVLCNIHSTRDALQGIKSLLWKIFRPEIWEVQLTESEIKAIIKYVIKPLHSEMKKNAEELEWNFIDEHLERANSYGICAGMHRTGNDKPLYWHVSKNGEWYPKHPADEWAYDGTRERWYRNTNDTLLFQANGRYRKLAPGVSFNGAFHPDFRYHAHLADHLAKKIMINW